jgi:chromosome segregation ATPase
MSPIRTLQTVMILFALLWTGGCDLTPMGDKDRKAAEDAGARARAEQQQASDAARRALDARLTELQHRVDALQKDAKPTTAKARRELDEQMKKLQDQVAELRSKLSTERGRAEEWNKVKDATEEAAKQIEHKLDQLAPGK